MSEHFAENKARPVGFVLNPNAASAFGGRILQAAHQYRHRNPLHIADGVSLYPDHMLRSHDTTRLVGSLRTLLLSDEDQALVDIAKEKLLTTMPTDRAHDLSVSFLVGNFGDSSWHIDGPRGKRLLVNISEHLIALRNLRTWNSSDFCELNPDGSEGVAEIRALTNSESVHVSTIPYLPGRGVLIDNDQPFLSERLPHAGSTEATRVVMVAEALPISGQPHRA